MSTRYQTAVPLGRGAMGEVYKAYDPQLGRFVALKYLRAQDPELVARLMREARLQARVAHASVCQVYEVGADEGRSYIAMQYIDGETLERAAAAMPLADRVRVLKDVAEAVHAAHECGLVHRDLKPQNIMVEARPHGGWKAYVLDFGLAREAQAPGLTASGIVLGTPGYMAPEQVRGDVHALDRRTDVYALGAVLYRLAVGRPPFTGSDLELALQAAQAEPVPPSRLEPSLSRDLETVILKCLEKEPARRYPTMAELAEDLGRFLAGLPVQARRAGWASRLLRRARAHPLPAAVTAAAVLLSAGLGGAWARGRWTAAERARLAVHFGEEVERIDSSLHTAYLLPLHDVRPEKARVRARMRRIEEEMRGMGRAAEGPGRYALARGNLALEDYAGARRELEAAWQLGYRPPEVAYALAQAFGGLYREVAKDALRTGNKALREARLSRIESEMRRPALEYLRQAGPTASAVPRYVEGQIAFYDKRYDDAIRFAREVFAAAPWRYEAKRLEGDAHLFRGRDAYATGELDRAGSEYQAAQDAYAAAVEMARSDPAARNGLCACGLAVFELRSRQGQPVAESFQSAEAACDRAVTVDPDWTESRSARSVLRWVRAGDETLDGEERTRLLTLAMEDAEQAIRVAPSAALGYRDKGTAAAVRADFEMSRGHDPRPLIRDAIAGLATAVRLDPSLAEAVNNEGYAYGTLGEYEGSHGVDPRPSLARAVEMHERAAAMVPTLALAHNSAGVAHKDAALYQMRVGDDPRPELDRALASYRHALDINPKYFFALPNVGNALIIRATFELEHGRDPSPDLKEARRALEAALGINAKAFPAYLYLAKADLVEARWAIRQDVDPGMPLASAERALAQALSFHPRLADPHQIAAEVHRWRAVWRAGRHQPRREEVRRGLAEVARALSIKSGSPRALAVRGTLLLLDPSVERDARLATAAADSLEEALRGDPNLRLEFSAALEEARQRRARSTEAGRR